MNTQTRTPSCPEALLKSTRLSDPPRHRLLACLVACLAALALPTWAQGPATPIYILTESNEITTATLGAPGATGTTISITGITMGETLVSIDVRPQNQALYGIGVNAMADTVQIYHISPQTGLAVRVGVPFSLTTDGSTVVDFPATGWDIDFNPTVDRMRLMTESGLNFRANPNNGTPVDGQGGTPGINPDGSANGGSTSVSGTAYTNSLPNTTITTQYSLDAATDSLYIQNPPNNGTLISGLPVTLNGAPLDFTAVSGFDIDPSVLAGASNAGVSTGSGYAALTVAGLTKLYEISLANGSAREVGAIAARSFTLRPNLGSSIGLNTASTALVRFSPLSPGTATTVALGAITAGETLVAIDMRPHTGQLFGLGIDAAADTGTLYLLDPQTGAATAIGTPGSIAYVDAMGAAVDFPVTGWDIDFNPTVDRMRLVNSAGLNARANPNDGLPVDGNLASGTPAGINPDGLINGPVSGIDGTSYTNSFGGTTVTTQYSVDTVSNSLYIQNPPNNGTQTLPLLFTDGDGLEVNIVGPVGFDIPNTVTIATSNLPAVGSGYFTANVNGINSLYQVDLGSGALINLGQTASPLSSFALFAVPSAPIVTDPTVADITPSSATLGGTVGFDGGSTVSVRGIVLATTAASATPTLGGTGVTDLPVPGTSGIFVTSAMSLTPGVPYSFRAYAINAAGTTYSTVRSFTLPVLVDPTFPAATVGQDFSFNLNLADGSTVTAKGLPSGLKLNGKTGTITGRITAVAGVYQVVFTAKGPNGSVSYVSTLVVQGLPSSAIGTFIAYIAPSNEVNRDTGGRLELTTTAKGSYTLKIIQCTKTLSAKGFLTPSTPPSLFATFSDGTEVDLDLQPTNLISGTVFQGAGTASLSGWRKTYDRVLNPASSEMGYCAVALEVGIAHQANADVPQGTGFAGITIGEDGSTKIVGKAADGSALTCAAFIGPNGETLFYAPTYKKLGAISGVIIQTLDPDGSFIENAYTGSLIMTKPATTGRNFPAAFSLVALDVDGKYLARAPKGSIVLGLPSSSTPSTLDFSGAGIELSATNPDLNGSVSYPALKALVPTLGGVDNPGRTTVMINASTGSLTGGFTLLDGRVKRSVKYQGMIIRRSNNTTLANGYFLLPQLPAGNQTPILSGRVDLLP